MTDPDRPRRLSGRPRLGDLVEYHSRTGTYYCPALVCGIQASLSAAGVAAGAVPALESETHVHLTVFTPGTPGRTIPGVEVPANAAPNQGGTYPEWSVPYDPDGTPGTWRWLA